VVVNMVNNLGNIDRLGFTFLCDVLHMKILLGIMLGW